MGRTQLEILLGQIEGCDNEIRRWSNIMGEARELIEYLEDNGIDIPNNLWESLLCMESLYAKHCYEQIKHFQQIRDRMIAESSDLLSENQGYYNDDLVKLDGVKFTAAIEPGGYVRTWRKK